MSEDRIGYARLTQEALRGVVKGALKVAEGGLPGDHHFYISFRTQARGVQLAKYLMQRYPEEMMIVLQHQYDNLEVDDDRFAVTLHFNGVPQRIVVPFNAISRFHDPSVRFALPFDVVDDLSAASSVHEPDAQMEADEASPSDSAPASDTGAVVSLDAFRRKK
jgi:uncharacterized protein